MASRRIINTQPKVDLNTLIVQYYNDKREASTIDGRIKKNNVSIKDEMSRLGLESFTVDDVVATVTTTVSENFNDDIALEILKQNLTDEQKQAVIKTREYIDHDALEALIYSKVFDAGLLQNCITKGNPVVTLRISKAK